MQSCPSLLDTFLAWTEQANPEGIPAWLDQLREADRIEEAFARFKSHWKDRKALPELRKALEDASTLSRARRTQRWQTDPGRRTLRLRLEVTGPATQIHPPALQAALARALEAGGAVLALGLGKHPRPLVEWGAPLPLGVAGLGEWVDIVLRQPFRGALPEQVNPHCPQGLRILESLELPNYGSSSLTLGREAQWRWTCPPALQAEAQARLETFMGASSYQIDKAGKAEGRKVVKRLEVRDLVLSMAWEGGDLLFSTRLAPGEAMNPQKLLGGILSLEPAEIHPLIRERVILRNDPRIQQADRFQAKLHNIYEDAVLLESGGNITLVDEDDETVSL